MKYTILSITHYCGFYAFGYIVKTHQIDYYLGIKKNQDNEFNYNSPNDLDFIEKIK